MRAASVLCFGAGLVLAACATPPAPLPPAALSEPAPPAQPTTPVTSEPKEPPKAAQVASTSVRQQAALWRTNAAAIAIIKTSEGLRLEAYQLGGAWYIGYGHAKTAKPGMTITETEAEALLRQDLKVCEDASATAVTVPVTENEFSAMVSLCYNVGPRSFAGSSVVRKLNAGDRAGAADAFLLWNKAGGVVIPHLVERREKERALFLA